MHLLQRFLERLRQARREQRRCPRCRWYITYDMASWGAEYEPWISCCYCGLVHAWPDPRPGGEVLIADSDDLRRLPRDVKILVWRAERRWHQAVMGEL